MKYFMLVTFFSFIASSSAFGKAADSQKSKNEKSLNHIETTDESEVITDDREQNFSQFIGKLQVFFKK